jgi:hypothetical protein
LAGPLSLRRLPNVTLGIIPLGPELPIWHTHGFVVFDERVGGPAVHIETLTSAINVRAEDVKDYLEAFTRLQAAAALTSSDARTILEQLAAEVRQTAG